MITTKAKNVVLRMSPLEKKRFEQAAAEEGMSLSEWLRWLARLRIEENEEKRRLT
jgi:predicted HicB family RNase H-like nuclease